MGGQDVVRVAVKVLAGPVGTHRGPRIGVAGSDLDVPQIQASIGGLGVGVAERVRDELLRQARLAVERLSERGLASRNLRGDVPVPQASYCFATGIRPS